MARNLGQTSCARCGKEHVIKLVEKPRAITVEEAGVYFPEYEGMLVAHACCWICGALYLGWVDERPRPPAHQGRCADPVSMLEPGGYFDLSYRSTFDNEPGDADLPPWNPNAVETLCTEAIFLINRALAAARKEPDQRISETQVYNLRKAEYELLGAWDCRNDQPRHSEEDGHIGLRGDGGAPQRSKTMKYHGTGATFQATFFARGDLFLTVDDGGIRSTRTWATSYHELRAGLTQQIGEHVLQILEERIEVLRREGRLYV